MNLYLPFFASFTPSQLGSLPAVAYLDHVKAKDIEPIRQWRNAQRPILRQNALITAQEQIHYWHYNVWPEMAKPSPKLILFSYVINDQKRLKPTQNQAPIIPKLVGYGGFVYIDWQQKKAELSTLLNPQLILDHQFSAYSSYFIKLSLMLAFQLGLQRLEVEIFDIRTELMSCLEQIGFICYDHKLATKRWQGMTYNSYFYSLTLTPAVVEKLQENSSPHIN